MEIWVFYSPFSPSLIVTHCPYAFPSLFLPPNQVSLPHVAPTQLASLCRTRDSHVDVNTDSFLPRWWRFSEHDNIEGNSVGRRRRMYERLPGGWWVCPRPYVQVRQDQSIMFITIIIRPTFSHNHLFFVIILFCFNWWAPCMMTFQYSNSETFEMEFSKNRESANILRCHSISSTSW